MAGFLLRFLLVYVLLMVPWPGVSSHYRRAFMDVGGFVFGSSDPGRGVRFEALEDNPKGADTTLLIHHRPTGQTIWMHINSREIAYLPTVLVFSLVLATPARWPRRAGSLLVGLAAVHGFIAIRLLTLVVYWSNKAATVHGAAGPPLWDRTVEAAVQFVGVGQPVSYVLPIVIWLLVAARREHLEMLLPADGHK